MMRFLLPLILALAGLGAGVGAGLFLRPAAEAAGPDHATGGEGAADAHAPAAEPTAEGHSANPEEQPEYAKLNNQFIVPIIEDGRVASMVILSLSLEVPPGGTEQVYAVEPKLRDGMLSVLFDHANAGGFRGAFTEAANLVALRRALLEVARSVLGPTAIDVLITDIMRQDS
ncbi:flagellar basal body-associated protein FliL [Rhodobacter sphaeroides]|uniref:flagellar basal body-associated FliL family protein n=1 Tax=Cereibacter sphaeroides TaxID=1063 RepID=UPI00132497A5|nr:flagellar basal body-associated FliL family protein [Cereibacter sphaeroides]MWP37194.1 flagellar basal body-associated protein FliL [Cereibacter sphaeroides]